MYSGKIAVPPGGGGIVYLISQIMLSMYVCHRRGYVILKCTVVHQNKIGQSVTLDSFTIQKFV
jgi:hypothetical protein